jgi:hypothetical protein
MAPRHAITRTATWANCCRKWRETMGKSCPGLRFPTTRKRLIIETAVRPGWVVREKFGSPLAAITTAIGSPFVAHETWLQGNPAALRRWCRRNPSFTWGARPERRWLSVAVMISFQGGGRSIREGLQGPRPVSLPRDVTCENAWHGAFPRPLLKARGFHSRRAWQGNRSDCDLRTSFISNRGTNGPFSPQAACGVRHSTRKQRRRSADSYGRHVVWPKAVGWRGVWCENGVRFVTVN